MILRIVIALGHLIVSWPGATVAALAAAYYGPKKMLETWDWYVYRFVDSNVFEIIDEPIASRPGIRTGIGKIDVPYFLNSFGKPNQLGHQPAAIAETLGRKESSVIKSLYRLRKCKKAVQTMYGWYSTETAP